MLRYMLDGGPLMWVLLSLSILGLAFGAFLILLPTALIGVCANPDMICNSVMKPTLILIQPFRVC